MRSRLLIVTGAVVLAGVVAIGVALAVTPGHDGRHADLPPGVLLATIDVTGGFCLDPRSGGGVICRDRAVITASTVTVTIGSETKSRPLTADELRRLLAAIDEFDPNALEPFTGICPIAYDGTKRVYTFHGVDGSFDSCRWDLAKVRAAAVASAIVG